MHAHVPSYIFNRRMPQKVQKRELLAEEDSLSDADGDDDNDDDCGDDDNDGDDDVYEKDEKRVMGKQAYRQLSGPRWARLRAEEIENVTMGQRCTNPKNQ
ncbi:hypothetical protein AB6A40_001609 [Gnathostoma spinigerum]|uniref:Uncharacterized protein n=1 Tax=Gnathostoma spinigerum TaxID=75299 RepID=A0ABD6E4K5_9BILA